MEPKRKFGTAGNHTGVTMALDLARALDPVILARREP